MKRSPRKTIAAITAAINLYLLEEKQAPHFIITPPEKRASESPWRFVGRKQLMDGRSLVQMRYFKR